MKRAASPADSSATKVRKCEVNPDLPLNISDIDDVQALVRANNAETRPKRRLKQLEFLNYAFSTLSLEALKDSAKVEVVQKLHGEFVSKHRCLPRNTVLSKVLYAWNNADLSEAAVSLVRAVMDAQDELPDAFRAAMDERVVTVMLRVLVKAPSIDYQLIDALLEHLPQEAYKRRVFSPLLQHGRDAMDIRFTMKVFERAQRCEIELWDEDYHHVLRCIEACHTSGSCSNADAAMYVEATLSVMESHHPVLGKSNCEIIQGLLGGLDSSIDGAGKCSRCAEQLRSFDLGDADRKNLLDDIENKLVAPRVRGLSHYDPEQTVSAVEEERRWAEFRHFQSQVRVMDYDTLIDGANVGYYGLSSWYQEEKERQLRAAGEDLASVPLHCRTQVPFPVDVSPKFSLIEDMRQRVLQMGRRPLIVLHQRHIASPHEANAAVLKQWEAAQALLPSPGFLNDDYCWLYAAVARPGSLIVSNDQMRDHHFSILSPRFFMRWRQRHRITYAALYHSPSGTTVLRLHPPRPYSVWVQRCLTSGGKSHWHLPYMASIAILEQATNKTTTTEHDVDLAKNGDDECSNWLCTSK